MRKYERGDIKHVDWMDHLLFREMERINKVKTVHYVSKIFYIDINSNLQEESDKSKGFYLYIEMPVFDFPLVYDEDLYDLEFPMCARAAETSFIKVVDFDMFRENPVENKHRKLVRSHRNGPMDRDLKPNAKIRDDLNVYFFMFFGRICQI